MIPYNLEVVWGLMRPKKTTSKIKEFIVGSFYSPPHYKKNNQLLDHLISTTHFLLSKYPKAGVVIGGDRNNLNIASLLSGIPRLRNSLGFSVRPSQAEKPIDSKMREIRIIFFWYSKT